MTHAVNAFRMGSQVYTLWRRTYKHVFDMSVKCNVAFDMTTCGRDFEFSPVTVEMRVR